MLLNKLCVVYKKDDSMQNVAVMSDPGVLGQRVWLVAASIYNCCFHRKNYTNPQHKTLLKQLIIALYSLSSCALTAAACRQRSQA